MSRTFILILIPFILLVACTAAPTATPAPTNTPLATATPQPTSTPLPTSTATPTNTPTATATKAPAILSGNLFLDANGNGLRDNASFVCPDAIATPPSLGYFFPSAKCNPGQLVTVMEPGLAGFVLNATVNGQPITATTDANGNYRMVIPGGTDGQNVRVNVTDPNAKDVALATRYINQWNKQVTVPAYEMNGVKVPEQRLNDTTVVPIAQGFSAKVGASNQAGLMQGFLTLPYLTEQNLIFTLANYVDLDPRTGFGLTYDGRTNINWKGDGSTPNAVEDQHYGLDIFCPKGALVIAPSSGNLNTYTSSNGSIGAGIDHGGGIQSSMAHFNSHLTKAPKVYQGQIIGECGDTGTNGGSHLHWHLVNTLIGQRTLPTTLDVFGTTSRLGPPQIVPYIGKTFSPGAVILTNDNGYWSVYNLMVYSR